MGNVIKQKSVISDAHCKNIKNYIDNKDAVLRDYQNIRNPENWFTEMSQTRETFGHDKAARKGSANTLMYHQVLALLPEDADINGGKMTPEMCMQYAKEYAFIRYPDQQIVFALHKEYCENDNTYRYAVHLVINRSNLLTGKRLDEGKAKFAKIDRANTVRDLDKKWDLQQLEKDVPNSKIHSQQPRGFEKKILEEGNSSYKNNLRKLCQLASENATSPKEYVQLLNSWGVEAKITETKIYAVDKDNPKYQFRVSKLDNRLNNYRLANIFKRNAGDAGMSLIEKQILEKQSLLNSYAEKKDDYLKTIETLYHKYRRNAKKMEGTDYKEFPILKLPKIPNELKNDNDINHMIFDYIRKGDNMRKYLATNVPKTNKTSKKNITHSNNINKKQEREERDNYRSKKEI